MSLTGREASEASWVEFLKAELFLVQRMALEAWMRVKQTLVGKTVVVRMTPVATEVNLG